MPVPERLNAHSRNETRRGCSPRSKANERGTEDLRTATALDGQGLPHALVHDAPGPSSGSPRRRVHEGGSSKRAYRTRSPSLVQGPRGIWCVWPLARLLYNRGPRPVQRTRPPGAMPAQGRHGATLPKERGWPEQCQLRGNRTGLRKILAAGAARAQAGPPVED